MHIEGNLLLIITLLLVIFLLMMVGERLRIAYPIFLVLGGLAIGFVPSIPDIAIDPDLVLLIFLPPLLYEAAWGTSWHEFSKYKSVIISLGFGLVIFTSSIVAYVSSAFIAGMSVPLGFLLGGIISPPDAVAASSILKAIRVPQKTLAILEGESLVNDAASLTVVRFALAIVVTGGTFVFKDAALEFLLVTFGGIFVGLAIAIGIYLIHKVLPTNSNMDVALTFVSPYLMYLSAEHFHWSGVMAVVFGGLFLSYRYRDFLNYESHMQAKGTWRTVGFVINGFIFILIGLEFPIIVKKVDDSTLHHGITYGLLIGGVTILIRLIWVYGTVYGTHFWDKIRHKKTTNNNWRDLFLIGWAGMRGVVSLAAALSIPLTLSGNATPFPNRDLILLITFIVVFMTLVFQGLSLPFVIKILNINEVQGLKERTKNRIALQLRLMSTAVFYLKRSHHKAISENKLLSHYKNALKSSILLHITEENILVSERQKQASYQEELTYLSVMTHLVHTQREELRLLRRANLYEESLIREKEQELDLLEAHLRRQKTSWTSNSGAEAALPPDKHSSKNKK